MKRVISILFVLVMGVCALAQNSNGPHVTKNITYTHRSETKAIMNCTEILVFNDDPGVPLADTYEEMALMNLGASYTFTSDESFFTTQLGAQTWDIIVFNGHGNSNETIFTLLNDHVNNGGKLIFSTWVISGNALFTTLGVSSAIGTEPNPVFWWETSHPLLNVPNTIPDILTGNDNWGIDGLRVTTLAGFSSLGGYTATNTVGETALTLGNGGNTVHLSFFASERVQDENSNGKPDMVELYENLLSYVCDPNPVSTPISSWPIYVLFSILLGGGIVVYLKR